MYQLFYNSIEDSTVDIYGETDLFLHLVNECEYPVRQAAAIIIHFTDEDLNNVDWVDNDITIVRHNRYVTND